MSVTARIRLVRDDVTRLAVDASVNAANASLLVAVDAAVHAEYAARLRS